MRVILVHLFRSPVVFVSGLLGRTVGPVGVRGRLTCVTFPAVELDCAAHKLEGTETPASALLLG